MAEPQIRFDDGAAYERMMGNWSRRAGNIFLDWVAPPPGLRWLDIGCGNGAITELIIERCAPAEIHGIDPSEGQLAFARTRPGARFAKFHHGNAMDLPFPDASFDAAIMALVIFFVPDPKKGVAEMARVVAPGGIVATYAWDMFGGGFPMEPIQSEMREMGMKPMAPPSAGASRIDTMRDLWAGAGLEDLETRTIAVERSFADFEDFWTTSLLGGSVSQTLAGMGPGNMEKLKERVRARLPAGASGRITYGARANAIKGRVPK